MPATPERTRIYAVGDVHGCLDRLLAVHSWVERDLKARPAERWFLVHVGDYIDRGPDSAGTLAYIADRAGEPEVVALRGNHDQYLLDALADPHGPAFMMWMRNGGGATLESFGIKEEPVDAAGRAAAMAAVAEGLSSETRGTLARLPHLVRLGDYAFVHAGVRPGVALEDQRPEDLLWIREPFLGSTEDHGAVVVHGHTVSERPELRPNRIGIDTGCVFGGPLTCLVLEGTARGLLEVEGVRPLGPV